MTHEPVGLCISNTRQDNACAVSGDQRGVVVASTDATNIHPDVVVWVYPLLDLRRRQADVNLDVVDAVAQVDIVVELDALNSLDAGVERRGMCGCVCSGRNIAQLGF